MEHPEQGAPGQGANHPQGPVGAAVEAELYEYSIQFSESATGEHRDYLALLTEAQAEKVKEWLKNSDKAYQIEVFPTSESTACFEDLMDEIKSDLDVEECSECEALVDRDDPYFSTPCGTFCENCMTEKHAKACEICALEFDLDGPDQEES